MADLNKRNDREDWLKWAIEFMKRGLWAGDCITVDGPHTCGAYASQTGTTRACTFRSKKYLT
jgi:hypothetical protein